MVDSGVEHGLGMPLTKLLKQLRNQIRRNGDQTPNRQRSLDLAGHLSGDGLHVVGVLEQGTSLASELFPSGRQRQAFRMMTHEKFCAKKLLERHDRRRYGGLRDVKALCGRCQRQAVGSSYKVAQLPQSEDSPSPGTRRTKFLSKPRAIVEVR